MNYIVHYDLAAILICLIVGILFFSKKHVSNKSNRLFLMIGLFILLSSVFDAISVYTLAHIDTVPLWLNYFVNSAYFLTFNTTYIVYFIYIRHVTHRNNGTFRKLVNIVVGMILGYLIFVTVSTPFTKLIFYFEDGQYIHGPLHTSLYVIAFVMLGGCIFTIVTANRKINSIHIVTTCFIAVISIVAVLIQFFWNELLLVNFVASLLLFMLFHSLQNPDDYLDKELNVFNVKAFLQKISQNTNKKKGFSVLAFELEGLQFVAQFMGVESENELLAAVVRECSHGLKGELYHLTGTRFAYVFEKKSKDLEEYADWLKWRFVSAFQINRVSVNLTMRMCKVDVPEVASTTEELFNAIDATLLEAMEENSYDLKEATKEGLEKSKRSTIITHILKNAVRNKSFEVYFQPIYSFKDHAFTAAEALVRLKDPELGFIPPDEFIPLAEKSGLILEVGDIVFHRVCEFLQTSAEGLGVHYIEVNLSMVQCMQEDLHKHLKSIMDQYGIPYDMIDFEVTETFHTSNTRILLDNMAKLIDSGCTFAVDDYGTGFSNTDYLIEYPFELVKLDKSVVWSAVENEKAHKILEHTAAMIKSLGLRIVAEGVETYEQVEMLRHMGCDYLQGYYFSKPVPPELYIEFMSNSATHIKEKLAVE